MSEDAPVNTGAAIWPDLGGAETAVRSMQTRLHQWAGADRSRRFDDLFNLVYDRAFLVVAWERVSTNKGARTPGIDKITAPMVAALGKVEDSLTGTPQGGILSPLLANVALSAFDDHFHQQWREQMGTPVKRAKRKRHGLGNWKLVRYADDFVLMVKGERHHAQALREEVSAVLAPLGLRLAQEKTQVVHIDEGFVFLGHTIRRQRKRGTTNKYYVYTRPSPKAIQSIKDKVNMKTYRHTHNLDLDDRLLSINRSLQGWANYFRHDVAKATFKAVDSHAWNRIMRWLRRKYDGRSGLSMKEMRRRFCDKGWRFAHNGVVFRGAASVRIERYRYRGNNIPTPWALEPKAVTG